MPFSHRFRLFLSTATDPSWVLDFDEDKLTANGAGGAETLKEFVSRAASGRRWFPLNAEPSDPSDQLKAEGRAAKQPERRAMAEEMRAEEREEREAERREAFNEGWRQGCDDTRSVFEERLRGLIAGS